eukprot:CAMPEP_0197024786 /NCGR_PEP_ID=MMETSP1384-20130603/5281_1 /TAXON_ID=29189 /ORGANISM="Ammonia sp." /LENGTH=313 /DNA_ID=CAMNT_0042453235 /DNA_START=25 /DNA_END=966 /DNA_ORIENTATION=-
MDIPEHSDDDDDSKHDEFDAADQHAVDEPAIDEEKMKQIEDLQSKVDELLKQQAEEKENYEKQIETLQSQQKVEQDKLREEMIETQNNLEVIQEKLNALDTENNALKETKNSYESQVSALATEREEMLPIMKELQFENATLKEQQNSELESLKAMINKLETENKALAQENEENKAMLKSFENASADVDAKDNDDIKTEPKYEDEDERASQQRDMDALRTEIEALKSNLETLQSENEQLKEVGARIDDVDMSGGVGATQAALQKGGIRNNRQQQIVQAMFWVSVGAMFVYFIPKYVGGPNQKLPRIVYRIWDKH